jgi:polysaccharide biosynthesis transport protein
MDNNTLRMEPLPRLEPYPGTTPEKPWRDSRRARLFALVFGLSFLTSLIWVVMQPVIYRSSATVLMSAPTAIDVSMAKADVQNVAIQRRILMGNDITNRLIAELEGLGDPPIDTGYLREVLRVEAVPETNLVEMAAQGVDGEILPYLVNSWIDVYLDVRAEDIERSKRSTVNLVQGELDELAVKLEEARFALEQFREKNEIISVERQENEVLARLDGLNKALNVAIAEEVKAKAYLDALGEALAKGGPVVPQSERGRVQAMQAELRRLRGQLSELTQRYTMDYINKEPRYRDIPKRIEELETQLAQVLSKGRKVEVANAVQAHAATEKAVQDLQQKLDQHKQSVSQFNTMYQTHQALANDLARLEQLNRETQARLVQVEVRRVEKYPQVSVIDRPAVASVRVGPNYLMLLGAGLAVSLGLGILSVWLYSFLGHSKPQPAYVTFSGVHMHPQDVSGELGYTTQPDLRIKEASTPRLQEGRSASDDGDENATESGDKPPQ